jgi:raffinose/stachyose/melibiose transport system permease protein
MTATQSPVTDPESRGRRASRKAVTSRTARGRRDWRGWWFALPALVMYVMFVLRPMAATLQYSFYDWDGITPANFVGLENYRRVLTDPMLVSSIWHAFFLVIFFTLLPVAGGLIVAALLQEIRLRGLGSTVRTALFLPQIIPGAAAAVAWVWMFSANGTVNQILSAVGLDGLTRAWLGDFTWSLPAVGVIGAWLGLGFCTILLISGIGKIDTSIYEAAKLDGAGFFSVFTAVTLPGLRQEIGVCVTVTIIAALASFDLVFMSTQGGPGTSTMVPGVLIYQLGFTESRVGLASALAIVLTALVLTVILPIQRLFREK